MKIDSTPLADGLIKISIDGRLDVDGIQAIEDRFAFLTTTSRTNVIVDMSAVSFLASLGIRMLLVAARGQHSRGGKLALASLQPPVKKVVVSTGIDRVVQIYDDIESAKLALAAQ